MSRIRRRWVRVEEVVRREERKVGERGVMG